MSLRVRLALVSMILLGVASTAIGVRNACAWKGSQDLEWQPSRILLFGDVPAHKYLALKNGPGHGLISPTPAYPASALVFLWPVVVLPWPIAKTAWATLNVGFILGILVLLKRLYLGSVGNGGIAIVAGLFLASMPVRITIGNGQYGLFVMFCFLLALEAERRKQPALAAFALAVSWFKYTITFPLSLIFFRLRRIHIVFGGLLVHSGLTLGLSLWTGTSPLQLVWEPLLIAREFVDTGELDVFSLSGWLGITGIIPDVISMLIVLATAYVTLRYHRIDELFILSALSLMSCIAFYHRTYDYVVMLFPLTYLVRSWELHRAAVPAMDRLILMLFGALILITWYAWRIVDAAIEFWPGPVTSEANTLLIACVIALLYGSFGMCMLRLFVLQRRVSTTMV